MSSAIAAIHYDPTTRLLTVVFVKGGYHEYHDVPVKVYREFMAAPSKGRYFNAYIRDMY